MFCECLAEPVSGRHYKDANAMMGEDPESESGKCSEALVLDNQNSPFHNHWWERWYRLLWYHKGEKWANSQIFIQLCVTHLSPYPQIT